MEKKKKWQAFLIYAVIGLTVYNILPTIFYYSKPLKSPITKVQAEEIGRSISHRTEEMKTHSDNWLRSFCKLLNIKPLRIENEDSNLIKVKFAKTEEAAILRKYLPRAGSLIPFVPAQLGLASDEAGGKEVLVQRRVTAKIEENQFSYAAKDSEVYRELIIDRAAQIVMTLCGTSEPAFALSHFEPRYLDAFASQIISIADLFENDTTLAKRYAASFTQGPFSNRTAAIQSLISHFQSARDEIKKAKSETTDSEKLKLLEAKESQYIRAEKFLKKHEMMFVEGQNPWTIEEIEGALRNESSVQFGNRNPLFSGLKIDWEGNQLSLKLHTDVIPSRVKQPLINEIAKVGQIEKVSECANGYTIALHNLSNHSGYLVLDLEKVAQNETGQILTTLKDHWHPIHADLKNLTLIKSSEYELLSPEQKALSLVFYTPQEAKMRKGSLYVVAKGIDKIIQNYEKFPHSEEAELFNADFRSLVNILRQNGFTGYQGQNNEFVFEKPEFHRQLLASTREDFTVRGTQRYATLELSDLEQRLIASNKIDTKIHEELIKWRDEYNAAQVNLNPASKFDIPKPTRNLFLENVALTLKKIFRGDETRVIKWGLDLSGGKTVEIELQDTNHRTVKNDSDIKQGINELYNRVNKMGVSEVAIRQVGNHIVLDFPGSQVTSASELIKASSMYFHVVNEKFARSNPALGESVNRFLQEVWNEAIVTHRKDAQSINEIAYNQLQNNHFLRENGLVLQSPDDPSMSHSLSEEVSKIAILRGENFNDWYGQTHPLIIVFNNYALEGSQLDNIRSNYDPSKGNYLSFDVKSSSRNDLQSWTGRFSKEKILGTALEEFTKGRGWRMAVVLNDTVISAPTLDSALRDSAMISGSFSQREVNQLAADLKAGSLTFTPHILSEKNVSPELGQQDRFQGITATIVALLLVILAMVSYYRFAGWVASVAVLFNLLILWATLQNLGATLSLAGIAGIILTVGMAVDANVLVFERIKEEFAITGRIAGAIAEGYKKAYSAIIDSNVTTIIAALILLNFDAGPIKGFAITLIIGIVSSMFTALFMTRFYFNGWIQNPKNKVLKMSNWIKAKSIDFLKTAKVAFTVSTLIIVAGGYLVYAGRSTIFGMDFTGGFSLNIEVEPKPDMNYLASVEKAFSEQGITSRDFQIRELTPSNQLRVLFGTSMDLPGKPFHNMSIENNPRVDWVAQSLDKAGISLTPDSLSQLDKNWTAMSGQMSDTMRNNALIGLLISFVCIFIYITFRFEYKFAAASILCLIHDVLITIGLMGILHALGVPVQIDLNTVAALMTIVGYSLNDTIIIFDRIREEMLLRRNKPLPFIVNSALNATLSRTTITSGTTLLVLISLVGLGGASIFSFALVMTIGVLFGTLSSWYIASPLMLFFHKKEEEELAEQT